MAIEGQSTFGELPGGTADGVDTVYVPGPAGPTGPSGRGIPTGGSIGQVIGKTGTDDYDTGWTNAGSGDMAAAVYDPTGVEGNAFDMENMVEGSTKKILTAAERAKLAATSGTNTGDQTNISGNAATVTTINGKIGAGTNVSISGAGTNADPYLVSSTGGTGTTNLGFTPSPTNGTVTSDTGTDATIPLGNGTNSGLSLNDYTTAEKSKLSGIEASADVTDAANVAASGAFMKAVDDTDDITVGATNKFATATEKTKLGFITVTQTVDLDAIEARVDELDASVILKGGWNAGTGTFPGGGVAQAGWSYIVSTGGTVDGQVFTANDRIVAILDNASTTIYASNWLKLDYTDAVLSVVGLTGAVSKINLLSVLNVEDGADVTDTANVTSAGALMDSEVASLTGIKTLTVPDNTTISAFGKTLLDDADAAAARATLGNVPTISSTDTITNKRMTRRAPTVTQSATPAINTDITDVAHITGLAQAITSMTTNLTGTPVEGDMLRIDITDNGTARAITWGASFEASTVALPTTTVISTRLDMVFVWNTVTSKWRIVGVA